FDTTAVSAVLARLVDALAWGGTLGIVGAAPGMTLDLLPVMQLGRRVQSIVEGNSVPRVFIPQLLELRRQGRFPLEKLVRTFPFPELETASAAATSGEAVEAVLVHGRSARPGGAARRRTLAAVADQLPVLRPLRPADAPAVLAAFASAPDMARQGEVTTPAQAEAYVRPCTEPGRHVFAVTVADRLVGAVGVAVDEEDRLGWVWYWMHAEHRGRGWTSA